MVSQNAIIAALASTGLISLAPNVLLLLFPHYARGEGEHSHVLALGQAMAAGGLLGDVFLHTIPHAQGGEEVGLWILLGFAIFLVADMLLRAIGAGHSHDHHSHDHSKELKTSAILLNLAADAMHNFTDGLAIGASFAISSDHHHHHQEASVFGLMRSRGGLATLSIMFHEIPHELGDFAVLVKNGFSKRQAIMAQFGTAVAAMAGTMVGILLEGFAGESLIYITAGGFVYLAACTILPELLEDRATLKFRAAQIVFFGAGIAFLYAVGYLETFDGGHGGHSHGHHHHGHESKGHLEKSHDHHRELHKEHSHHHQQQAPHDHHDHDHGHHHNHEL